MLPGHLSVSERGFLSDSSCWPGSGKHLVDRLFSTSVHLAFTVRKTYLENTCADLQLLSAGIL